MQTVRTSKRSIDSRRDTVIDLQEYRRRLEAVDGSLALASPAAEPPRPRPVRTSRAKRRRTLSDWLDAIATVLLAIVALTVWIQLMI